MFPVVFVTREKMVKEKMAGRQHKGRVRRLRKHVREGLDLLSCLPGSSCTGLDSVGGR